MSTTFPGEWAEYRAVRDRLVEPRRGAPGPTNGSDAMNLAAPYPAQ